MIPHRWSQGQQPRGSTTERQSARQPARVIGATLFVAGVALLVLAAYTLVESRSNPVRAGSWETPLPNMTATESAAVSRPGGATAEAGMRPIGVDASASVGFRAAPSDPRPPVRLEIPTVGIDTPVVEVASQIVVIGSRQVLRWDVADYAAGHHAGSANPGAGGNVVLAGHSDWRGAVFGNLATAAVGDSVVITSADQRIHRYVVTEIHFRKEAGMPLDERLATGQFIEPTEDERVTLVSCWPPLVDDHRLIVVAKPDPAPRGPSRT